MKVSHGIHRMTDEKRILEIGSENNMLFGHVSKQILCLINMEIHVIQ